MSITLQIGSTVRAYSSSADELSLPASSVKSLRDLLSKLELDHAAVYNAVCHENGNVRPHVNLFVNSAMVDKADGLDTTLSPGDVVSIMHAVSGG